MNTLQIQIGPAIPHQIFDTLEALEAHIDQHGLTYGWGKMRRDSRPRTKPIDRRDWIKYSCNKSKAYTDQKDPDLHESKRRKGTGTKKTNCPYLLRARRIIEGQDEEKEDFSVSKWSLTEEVAYHNHNAHISTLADAYIRQKTVASTQRALIESMLRSGTTTRSILNTLAHQHPNISIISRDVYNIAVRLRREKLGGKTPVQWLLDLLQERNFNLRFRTNPHTNRLRSLLFFHPTSVTLWRENPYVLLLDSTYKTNRYNMPLFNICALTGNNLVIQVGLAFMSGEKKEDYIWVMEQLREVMVKEGILEPEVMVTDRELALMTTIDTIFPSTYHILCRWHVNMNVVAKTKGFFPPPVKHGATTTRHPSFQSFLCDWNKLLYSATEQQYEERLAQFKVDHPVRAVEYVDKTWLCWKEKIVTFWLNNVRHFGHFTTSPIEGCHAGLKQALQKSTLSLDTSFERLLDYWEAQHIRIEGVTAQQLNAPRHQYNVALFQSLVPHIYAYALKRTYAQDSMLPANGPPTSICTGRFSYSMGLPCQHTIYHRKQSSQPLVPSDFHTRWHIRKPFLLPMQQQLPHRHSSILEPENVRARGRPQGALGGVRQPISSTRRDPSAFERIPPSSAPPNLGHFVQEQEQRRLLSNITILPSTSNPSATNPRQQWALRIESDPSTTHLGIERIRQYGDTYEAGTERERAYLRAFADTAGGPRLEDSLEMLLDMETSEPQEITMPCDTDATIAELEEFNEDEADVLIERQIFDNVEVSNQEADRETEAQWELWAAS
jgi:hypothetical protein